MRRTLRILYMLVALNVAIALEVHDPRPNLALAIAWVAVASVVHWSIDDEHR